MDTMLKRALGLVALALMGVIVATIGSGGYRSLGYVGAALAVLMVGAGALFAKTWHSWLGFGAYAAGWLAATYFFTRRGPGGSVLVPADDLRASIWIYGGAAIIALVAAIPPFVLTGRDVSS